MNKCKYCKDEKDHSLTEHECNEVYISNKYITAFCGWCGAETKVEIKYCPMCRQKFKGVAV